MAMPHAFRNHQTKARGDAQVPCRLPPRCCPLGTYGRLWLPSVAGTGLRPCRVSSRVWRVSAHFEHENSPESRWLFMFGARSRKPPNTCNLNPHFSFISADFKHRTSTRILIMGSQRVIQLDHTWQQLLMTLT